MGTKQPVELRSNIVPLFSLLSKIIIMKAVTSINTKSTRFDFKRYNSNCKIFIDLKN